MSPTDSASAWRPYRRTASGSSRRRGRGSRALSSDTAAAVAEVCAKGPLAIRVAFLAYLPEADKGGQINLLRLVSRLDRERFSPTVIVPRRDTLFDALEALSIPVHVAPVRHPFARRIDEIPHGLYTVWRLRRILRRIAPQVVYADAAEHVFPLQKAAPGVPLVWHCQTSFDTTYDRPNLARARVTVACATAVAARLTRLDERADIRCIPNAVDTDRYRPGDGSETRAALGVNENEQGLICVSEFSPRKGLHDAVEAVARLSESHPEACLWICGRGTPEQTHALETRIENTGARVRLLGYRQDIPALLQAANAFVIPSHSEGLSLALLEAMASGCPVVASDISGNREVVTHGLTGLIHPVESPRGLAEQLAALLDAPVAAAERAERAREAVLARHTIDRYAGDLAALLEEVAL